MRAVLLIISALLAQSAFAGVKGTPLDAQGNPVVDQGGVGIFGAAASGCRCDDGRLYHVKDKLIDLKDPNVRLEVAGISARTDYEDYQAFEDFRNKKIPSLPMTCQFDLGGKRIDATSLANDTTYKLKSEDAALWRYMSSSDDGNLCSSKHYVADPRVNRKYEFHPESGDQLIIGRDDPDTATTGKKIETDNKEVSLDGEIMDRMTGDKSTALPTLFPRLGEVVVANRTLEVTDKDGKKRKVKAGTPGIVTKREEGSIEVNLFYSKAPSAFSYLVHTHLDFANCPPWTICWDKPYAKRMSFGGDIKDGDFVDAFTFLKMVEEAQSKLPPGTKK